MTDSAPIHVTADPHATRLLVRHLRAGEAEAAAAFEQMYRDSLLRFCWGYLGDMDEAEDALQEISYKVLTAQPVPDQFRPWVYRIARNHCLNMLRTRKRHRDRGGATADSRLRDSLTGHLTRLVKEEEQSKLAEVVGRLPEGQREVLRLRYVEGLSRGEIGEVLEVPESTVKSRLYEAISALRAHESLAEDR